MSKYAYRDRVRTRLRILGRTQNQLAAQIGYSPSYLSRYLSGKQPNPTLRTDINLVLDVWEKKAGLR